VTGAKDQREFTRNVIPPLSLDETSTQDLPICAIACKDLLSYSRLASAAKAAGYRALQVEGPETVRAVAPQAALVLIDLQDPAGGLPCVRAAGTHPHLPVFAIGPHVETELLEAARDAGATQVLTHNAASKHLGELLLKTAKTPTPAPPQDPGALPR
jgi:CheY-like chemotaxis protein